MNFKRIIAVAAVSLSLIATAAKADTLWHPWASAADLGHHVSALNGGLPVVDPQPGHGQDGQTHGNWMDAFETARDTHGFEVNGLENIPRPTNTPNPPVVPEPMSYLLFITGGLLLAGVTYVRKMKGAKA